MKNVVKLLEDIQCRLARIEAAMIEQSELKALGHRIRYDGNGRSQVGAVVDPSLVQNGYQVRYPNV